MTFRGEGENEAHVEPSGYDTVQIVLNNIMDPIKLWKKYDLFILANIFAQTVIYYLKQKILYYKTLF